MCRSGRILLTQGRAEEVQGEVLGNPKAWGSRRVDRDGEASGQDTQSDATKTWRPGAGISVACSLQQGMQASLKEEKEEKDVHWESMQPATHPAFAILQHSCPLSPAQQHPQGWSDGCVSQSWAWGPHDPAFCGSVSHHAKLPQPSSTRAPSITAFPLAHAPQPAQVCRSDSGANLTATRPARPVLLSAQGWGAGRAQGSGYTPAPVLSLSHSGLHIRVERQDPSASSHPQEHPCASPSLLNLLILLLAAGSGYHSGRRVQGRG